MKYKLKALNKSSDEPISGSLLLRNAWQKNKTQRQNKNREKWAAEPYQKDTSPGLPIVSQVTNSQPGTVMPHDYHECNKSDVVWGWFYWSSHAPPPPPPPPRHPLPSKICLGIYTASYPTGIWAPVFLMSAYSNARFTYIEDIYFRLSKYY